MAGMSLTQAKHQSNLQFRRQAVYDCRHSGMTVKQWCEEHQIHETTYYRWQKEVWDRSTQALIPESQDNGSEVRFAQLQLPDCVENHTKADVVLHAAGLKVEIRNSANSNLVEQILRAVANHG